MPDQHRARAAVLDQSDAAQDEGAHDDLADLGRADHQRAHMRGVERQRGAAVGAGPAAGERIAPGELAHLTGELPDMMRRDRRLALEAVAPHDVDRALEHEPGGGIALADVEHHLARRERPRRPAGKALGGFDLRGIEHGKHLLAACFGDAHAGPPSTFLRSRLAQDVAPRRSTSRAYAA